MAPVLENPCGIFPSISSLKFLSNNARFGRSLAQLILATLSLYPFWVKERPKPLGLYSTLLGWIPPSWGLLLRAPPRCARYVPFFGFALSTCPLGCFRAGGRQRVTGALSHVSSRAFATAPLSSYPSDEFPLSSLPFGPKALVDVPFPQLGAVF